MEHEFVQSDADRYVIVEYIAEGGMGAIFLGKKIGMEGFEKEVVLKQLLPEFTSQREFIDLFLREAKLSATLDHANIVNTIDLVAAGDDYFIVMEYVRGGDLRSILRRIKQRGHNVHPAAALFIAREVLSALSYAHEKKSPDGEPLNLIHRDISPSNIMVSGSGEVKLTDFGIAKVSTHKSVFYRVKGKVGYMSPEQAYGDRPMDRRSDLYSLGVCLYEMLSGERLFVADLLSTPDQIYNQPIPELEGLPEIPAGIDAVLARALAIKSEPRFQSALEFQDALVRVAFENSIIFTPPDLAAHLKEVCGPDPLTWNQEEEEEPVERPGTEVLAYSGEGEAGQFSGVELTSIFTALPQQLGPEPSGFLPEPVDDSQDQEATRHRVGPIAFAPTRLAGDVALDPHSATAEEAFDFSDYGGPDPDLDQGPGPYPEAEIAPSQVPPAAESVHGELESSGGLEPWPTDADDEPTMAMDGGGQNIADQNLLESFSSGVSPVPQVADFRADPMDPAEPPRALDSEATVELRVAQRKGRVPKAPPPKEPAPAKPRRASAYDRVPEPGPDPILLTGRVAPMEPPPGRPLDDRRRQRHRILVIIAVGLLLLAGVAIVALVGLTGPDLEDLRGARHDGASGDATSPATSPLVTPGVTVDSRAAALSKPDQQLAKTPTVPLGKSPRALKVESSPSDAKVYLDSVYQCKTPCTIEELEGRVYLLSVRRARYVSWSSLVDMKGKQRVHINAYLSEEPDSRTVGYLMIRSQPRADVFVDSKEIGRVTSEGRIPLPPGQYEIMLSHPRQKRQPKFVITIQARKTYLLMPKF